MNFIRLNKQNGNHTKVSGICIVPKPHQLNTKWMDAEFQALLKSLDSFELRRAHDWAGEIEGIDANKKPWKIGCGMMMHQMVILPNGDVTVCCNDLNGKGIVGNIQQNKIPRDRAIEVFSNCLLRKRCYFRPRGSRYYTTF